MSSKGTETTQARRSGLLIAGIAGILVALAALAHFLVIPGARYRKAVRTQETNLVETALLFESLGGFFDAPARADACYLELGRRAVSAGTYRCAAAYFPHVRSDDAREEYSALLHDAALPFLDTEEYETGVRLLETIIGYRDSGQRASQALCAAGERRLAEGAFQAACDLFSRAGDGARAEACREACYTQLVAEYDETGRVPAGFEQPLLWRYADAGKYRALYGLQHSSWDGESYAQNVALLYELGDFEQMAAHGFAGVRLSSRYCGGGYYFEIDENGKPLHNLPAYGLRGYYGLYYRIDRDGVYAIGSDEYGYWTKMFRFTFSQNDEVLDVYCYTNGRTYRMTRED